MREITSVMALVALVAVLSPLYVNAQVPEEPSKDIQFQINGAGATFPFPLIDLWRVEYNKLYPTVSLNYQSIGSGGGIKQHVEKTVDFAASDAPLTKKERGLAPNTLHIPEAIGGVTVAYNVPEIPNSGLKLTGNDIAAIYLGEIKKWNDPKIAQNNPGVNLPDKVIVPVRRSDGSGTTYVFTDYLSTVSEKFNKVIGKGKSVQWRFGLGAAGNEGVAATVRSTPYSIGYVELAYAFQTGMTFAYIQNGDKTAFIEPTIETISAASGGVASKLPKPEWDWSQVTMVNAPGKDAYPIASFTYLLVYENLEKSVKTKEQAIAMVHMIHWMITDGQKHSSTLLYVPLSDAVKEVGKQALSRVKYKGETLFQYSGLVSSSTVPQKPATDKDSDKDGIPDSKDMCPKTAETKNGYQDTDGCPDKKPTTTVPGTTSQTPATDKDSDKDGIPDSKDMCPKTAETKNGYQDTDGCPDKKP